jgi:hypothetical protein
MNDIEAMNKPKLVYNNMGCGLTIQRHQTVRRVHSAAPHAKNVTIVHCANALGQTIPSMTVIKSSV